MRTILPVSSPLCRPLDNCIPHLWTAHSLYNLPRPQQPLATTMPLVPPCLSPSHSGLWCSEEEKLGLCGVPEGRCGGGGARPDFDLALTLCCWPLPPQTFKAPSWSMYTCCKGVLLRVQNGLLSGYQV